MATGSSRLVLDIISPRWFMNPEIPVLAARITLFRCDMANNLLY